MTRTAALALALPLVAACATVDAGSVPPGGGPATGSVCRNDQLQQFVGKTATADLGAEIVRVSGAKTLQWVAAGTMVTMDFREDRVRAYLDERNRVQRISCG